MVPFLEDLDANKIHVRAPTNVVFLCGGDFSDISEKNPKSLRDAFLKINDFKAIRSCNLIQAEDFTKLSVFSDLYKDILEFETDLAQITELIILFCESGGSLAELGAFCMKEEISSRLFVIVQSKYWSDDSFVKLGPLRSLINKYGEECVFALNAEYIIKLENDMVTCKPSDLKDLLQGPISNKIDTDRKETTFNETNSGHVIKLIVGIIQEWGGLTITEIDEALLHLGVYVPTPKIKSYLLCAASVDWIVEQRRGVEDYYFAKQLDKDAAIIRAAPTASEKNKQRRRIAIREYWQQNDKNRWAGILSVSGIQK